MATFSDIAGAEPSTVTFRLASVTQDHGGVTRHQEVVTIGGSESTLAIAQVRATAPASTEFGLVVRVADPSTGPFVISSLAGAVTVRSSAANALVSVYQSTAADLNVTVAGYVAPSTIVTVSTGSVRVHQSSAADLNVTVAGYVAPSTTVNVSSLAGAVTVRSSAANALVSVYQSTAADLNVTVAGYVAPSTVVTVSTIIGVVRIAGNNAADGIVHVGDSTNAALRVNVVAGSAASTTVNVSSMAGRVAIAGFHAVSGIINVTDSTNNAINVNVVAGAAGGSTIVTVSQLLDSSGGSVSAADSANNAIRVNVVAGAAGGSTIVTVSTGSVRVHQSSAADLNVTVAGYVAPSTTVNVSSLAGAVITRSSAASMLATVYQSTAADLNVTVAGYSTTVNISSLAGAVIVRSSAANALGTVYQSTASELQATARVNTSSGGAVEGSTASPAHTVLGLHVRQALSSLQSVTSFLTSSNSTALYSLISSVASMRHKVYAYFVASTHTSPSTLVFMSSAVGDLWAVNFGSGSSGVSGANLTISPPGFMFTTANQSALNCRIENVSTQVLVRVSLSYFTEP